MTDGGASLAGRVVVTGDDAVARAVAHDGATVVLVGTDAAALGTLAAEVRDLGGRAAVLVGDLADPVTGDATRATLAELLAELFSDNEPASQTRNYSGVATQVRWWGGAETKMTAGSRRWAKRRRVRMSATPVTRMSAALVSAAAASHGSDVAT